MAETQGSSSYQLSCELEPSHQSDVKAVLPLPGDRLASASRDQSVGIWKRSDDGRIFELQALLGGHKAYVNSLAHVPGLGNDEDEYLASGGNSALILFHSLRTLSPDSTHALIGHQLNVSTLAYSTKRRKLVSGSWDRTARVWRHAASTGEWECELVLEGHEEAVWGVLPIDQGPQEGGWLTASADRLIYLWSAEGELLMRFKGSPEPVRSLSTLPNGQGFASACNDGIVRKWDWTGSIIQNLRGHTDYVYQVITGPRGSLLSCGEDHTARVWDGGEGVSMLHPCQTVWSVGQCENGDVVTAGSDGRVRVWTTSPQRFASESVREAYHTTVTAAMKNYKARTTDTSVPAAQTRLTEPVTIDIDISDDAPPIPLTFHPGDDPREVAFEFGKAHDMSDNYINQIEQFIRANIG